MAGSAAALAAVADRVLGAVGVLSRWSRSGARGWSRAPRPGGGGWRSAVAAAAGAAAPFALVPVAGVRAAGGLRGAGGGGCSRSLLWPGREQAAAPRTRRRRGRAGRCCCSRSRSSWRGALLLPSAARRDAAVGRGADVLRQRARGARRAGGAARDPPRHRPACASSRASPTPGRSPICSWASRWKATRPAASPTIPSRFAASSCRRAPIRRSGWSWRAITGEALIARALRRRSDRRSPDDRRAAGTLPGAGAAARAAARRHRRARRVAGDPLARPGRAGDRRARARAAHLRALGAAARRDGGARRRAGRAAGGDDPGGGSGAPRGGHRRQRARLHRAASVRARRRPRRAG